VHRDVKPANLLISHDDVVKILDLGLAKLFDDVAPAAIERERILGTADFLAPEQAVDGHAVDCRADIYSLGCTFYFLLAGHPPFPGGTLPQRLVSHLRKAPLSIVEIRDDVPADLAFALSRMMAKTPADRFQTVDQVSEVLREWLAKHADPIWLRQHPAVLSGRNVLEKATAQRSTDAKARSVAGAAASAAVWTGSMSAGPSSGSSTSKMSPSNAVRGGRPSEASSLGVQGPRPSAGGTPPPTSSRSGPTTVGIDVMKVQPADLYGSSVIDSLVARRCRRPWAMRLRRSLSLEIIALVLTSASSSSADWLGSALGRRTSQCTSSSRNPPSGGIAGAPRHRGATSPVDRR